MSSEPLADAAALERKEYEKVLYVYGFRGVGLFSAAVFSLYSFFAFPADVAWLAVATRTRPVRGVVDPHPRARLPADRA